MRRFAVVFLVFVFTASGLLSICRAEEGKPASAPAAGEAVPAKPAPPPKYDVVGAPLPPLTMKSVDGKTSVNLSKINKPSMFMFVNSSCAACRAEMVAFNNLAATNKEKMDTYVVTVDFDPENTVKRFPDLGNMAYILLDGSDFEVAGKLGFNYTPATVITDASGKQRYRKGGFSKGDDMAIYKEIKNVLKK
jgi:peroxiredoxin